MRRRTTFGREDASDVRRVELQVWRDETLLRREERSFPSGVSEELKQQIVQAYATGEAFQMPAGAVSVVIGAEYRGFRYSLDPGAAGGPISGFTTSSSRMRVIFAAPSALR